ncbi:MAG: sporulation protein YqfD [Eubacteriales bacterium]
MADIVAAKGGFIVDMRVFAGTPQVAEGQAVKAGQILVSGDVTTKEGALVMQVAARADVWAQTSYTGSAAKPLTQMVAEKTGRVYNMKCMRLGDQFFPITPGSPPFENYSAEVKRVAVIGQNMPVSFKIYDIEIAETTMVAKPVDEAKLKTELQEAAYYRALAGGVDPQDITKVNVGTKKSETEMQVLVIIEAKEKIALARQR